MSGQSAHLSLKEAKAMQERIQHSGTHASTHGGKKSGGSMAKTQGVCEKAPHQG